jgi:hypothetical protein
MGERIRLERPAHAKPVTPAAARRLSSSGSVQSNSPTNPHMRPSLLLPGWMLAVGMLAAQTAPTIVAPPAAPIPKSATDSPPAQTTSAPDAPAGPAVAANDANPGAKPATTVPPNAVSVAPASNSTITPAK